MINLNTILEPNFPWYVVTVIKGVDVNNVHKDGFAEIGVDNKYQGKYLNICVVEKSPSEHSIKGEKLFAEVGDLICVWATAIESFKLFEYGNVSLVRNADIFMRIEFNSELYAELMSDHLLGK